MVNRYGQTDLTQALIAQGTSPSPYKTGLGQALRLGAVALSQYGDRKRDEKRRSDLTAALQGILPQEAATQGGAGIGDMAMVPNSQAEMLATMFSDRETAPLGMALLQQQMPKQPQYKEVGGNLVQIGPNGVSEVYRGPQTTDGFSLSPGQTRYDAQGNVIAQGSDKPEDRFITVSGVGVFDRVSNSYVGQGGGGTQPGNLPGPTGPSVTENLSPKAAQDVVTGTIARDAGRLADEEDALNELRSMSSELDRFEALLKVQDTGGILRRLPGAQSVEGAFDAEIQEMTAIQDRLTPRMRQGLPGAASDRDMQIFRGSTVGPDKDPQVNRNIILGYRAQIQNAEDRLAFRQAYFQQNKSLSGADEAWSRYLQANPIFDPDSPVTAPKMNGTRRSWREFFGAGGNGPRVERWNPDTDELEPGE